MVQLGNQPQSKPVLAVTGCTEAAVMHGIQFSMQRFHMYQTCHCLELDRTAAER